MRLARLLVPGVAASLILVGCSNDGDTLPTTASAPISPTTTAVTRVSDGQLTIGLLLPRGSSSIGDPLLAAARRAVEHVRDADGEITIVEAAEGGDATEAATSIASLLDEGVDAIVGPSSSTTTLGALRRIVDGGVLSCSPTATSLLLDEYPDNDLFFRSIASDSLQAEAIARLAVGTGGRTVSIAYLDDIYGRGLLDATRDALGGAGITDVSQIPISPAAETLTDQADLVLEPEPDIVIVLADNIEGPRMISALDDATRGPAFGELPDIVVNDAIRRPASPEAIRELRPELREQILGVSPAAASQVENGELRGNFAVNAYNCVTAIALAARQAGSDRPAEIAAELVAASTLGSPCSDYASCATNLDEGKNIDYQGPDGYFDVDTRGNISRARFDVFSFDEEGVDTHNFVMTIP